jgi:hypothetical protein
MKGAQAWDTFQTLLGTAKKLGVNFFHYLRDRIGGAHEMPALWISFSNGRKISNSELPGNPHDSPKY